MSLPIEEVISMLPISFNDETDIVVLKVHCAVSKASNTMTPQLRYRIVDNYPINEGIGQLLSDLPISINGGDTVNRVEALFLYCNGSWIFNIPLGKKYASNHIEDDDLEFYEEKEAYAIFPIVYGNSYGQTPLSSMRNWSNCPTELLENNKATWKELNEFL